MRTDFQNMLKSWLSAEEAERLIAMLDTPPPVSIRQHALKAQGELFQESEPIPWCPRGRYLSTRPVFTLDPRFHAGAYYVQEASGMSLCRLEPFLTEMTAPRILDACAAPGGKSTLLLDMLPEDGLLVSNETIRSRIPVLSHNIARWGYGRVAVTGNDPSAFRKLAGFFDVLVADVPCSGEGLFRKDPASRSTWSPALVDLCVARQRRIVSDLWPSLRQGGLLLYSTCTFNTKENEEQVDWICNTLGARTLLEPQKYLPHRITGEGFFLALLEKTASAAKQEKFTAWQSKTKTRMPGNHPEPLNGSYLYTMKEDLLKATPACLQREMAFLETSLHVVHSGIAVAVKKGNDWIPHPDLSLSVDLKQNAFPRLEVTHTEALAFLRKETVICPEGTEKGFVLITFEEYPLGFIKNLGKRSNNLHPASRRILMQQPTNHIS